MSRPTRRIQSATSMTEAPDHRSVYARRVNRAIDHIQANLDGDLSLHALARVAHLSPYHFHRVFKAHVGETLHRFVQRVRLERAARLMKASRRMTVTEVALRVGFEGLPQFSRAFKEAFGVAPSRWDRRAPMPDSKMRKAPEPLPRYGAAELEELGRHGHLTVRIERFERSRMVYFRVHDPYGSTRLVDAYERLMAWLGGQGLTHRDVIAIGMAPDDPEVTPPEKCRYDMGLLVPMDREGGLLGDILDERGRSAAERARAREVAAGWEPASRVLEHGMNVVDLGPFQGAFVRCTGDLHAADRAIQYLFGWWLPRSGWLPADVPGAEIFRKVPEEIGWETFDLELMVPIEPERGATRP